MTTASPKLRIQEVALHYDDGQTRALDGVSLEVAPGEFVAIVGPSGSGKSSLLNVIGTLEQPTAGQVYLDGKAYSEIRDASLFRRENIGFVFQSFNLIPTLTALENVVVPTVGGSGRVAAHRSRAQALLAQLGLGARMGHLPGKLSGGERQRVAIARALINNPRMILADEPTGSLDSANAEQVLDILKGVIKQQGLAMIMVTHDAKVSAHADRIIHMRDGRIEQEGGT